MQVKDLKKKFRLGVSGHRNLKVTEIDQYKKEVRVILQDLIKKYPQNEIFIVTSLAEGADKLVVECAVKFGLRYEVILPMDVNLYREDFDESSRETFNRFFLDAAGSYTLPLFEGNTSDQKVRYGKERDRQYLRAGQEVVDRSDHMIFLYDGVDNGLTGGTADILNYAKHENKSLSVIECKRENKGSAS